MRQYTVLTYEASTLNKASEGQQERARDGEKHVHG
jgi:hypothetical protein